MPFNKLVDKINERINDKLADLNDKVFDVNDRICNKVSETLLFKSNNKDIVLCEICDKETQFLSVVGDIKICRNCAKKLKLSSWLNVEFETNEQIENKKLEILSIANEMNLSDKVIQNISTYFENKLCDGLIYMLNGKKGQIIKIFEDYCEIITKHISDETKDDYFKMNGMSSFDFENILSNIDAGDVIMGLVGGSGMLKTGTKIAKNVAIKTAVGTANDKIKKRKRVFPVIEGKKILKYNEYDIVKVRKSDDDELGYILIQNSKYANDPDEDIVFLFGPTSSRNKKVSIIQNILKEKMSECQNNMNNTEFSRTSDKLVGANSSVADELLKFKNLLDMGVLTEDEFEEKKKQLLNL